MDLWNYLEVVGGFLLMIVCILGNFGWSYMAGYSQTKWQTLKRMSLVWLITTVVFCFFFVRKNVHPVVLDAAMLLPLKGLITGQFLVLVYLLVTRTQIIANRLKVFEAHPRFTITYEQEAAFLVVVQVIIGLAWIVSAV